jgi:hypothetical protein
MAGRPTQYQKLSLRVAADLADFKRKMGQMRGHMQKVSKSTSILSKGFTQLAGVMGGLFAVNQIKSFIQETVRLADVQLKAEAQLKTALGGNIKAFDMLAKQARDLQKITLFGDEETIKAQALIAAFVKEENQIKRIIPLVQDLASAKGMQLSAAADLVSKTLGSSTNALSRYGIQVEGAVGSTERLESLANGLSDAFGGVSEAMAKAGLGPVQQLKNSFGDLREEIGMKLLPVINSIAGALKNLIEIQLPSMSTELSTILTDLGKIFELYGKIYDIGKKELKKRGLGEFTLGKAVKAAIGFMVPEAGMLLGLGGKLSDLITGGELDLGITPDKMPGIPEIPKPKTGGGDGGGGGDLAAPIERLNEQLETLVGLKSQLDPEDVGILGGVILGKDPSFMDEVNERVDILKDKITQLRDDALAGLGTIVTNVFQQFASAFTSGENALKKFLDFFKKWAIQIIAQLVAIVALAAILSAIFPGAGGFKGIFGKLFKGSGPGKFLGMIKEFANPEKFVGKFQTGTRQDKTDRSLCGNWTGDN